MHTSSSVRLFAAVAAVAAITLASCSAPSTPDAGTGSSSASSATGADVPLSMRVDAPTALPGGAVMFTVTARNLTQIPLEEVNVDVTFPKAKMTVKDAQGGTVADDRIGWIIPSLAPGQTRDFAYNGVLAASLTEGDLVRTVASMRSADLSAPSVASAEVSVGAPQAASSVSSAVAVAAASSSSSESNAYSFFLGGETGSSRSEASSVVSSAAVSAPAGATFAIAQRADQTERRAGQRVRYSVTVRNIAGMSANNLTLQAYFPPSVRVTDGHIDWTVATLLSGQSLTFSYEVELTQGLKTGETVTTVVQVAAGRGTPQVATTDVHVIGKLPATGVNDRFFAPREDTSKYVTPVR